MAFPGAETKTKTRTERAETTSDNNSVLVPKISHDWYQTETLVVLEIRIKKLAANMVKVDMGDTSLCVSAKIPASESEYKLELDLAHPVLPAQSSHKVMSTIEIKLKKAEGVRWTALEGDGSAPLPGGAIVSASGVSSTRGPYSSGRDWSAIEKNIVTESEEMKVHLRCNNTISGIIILYPV